jgi:transcriptional regulator with XRE-family HTH domain
MKDFYINLGQRIKKIRESLGITQEKLANLLGVPRSTTSQIENGERKVAADELIKLADILNVSIAALIGLEKEPEIILSKTEMNMKKYPQIRINIPQKNVEKFKEVLLYILNQVGCKSNMGEEVIYKLLYFIDFNFYEKYEEQLIGATYIKNKYGPMPIEFKEVLANMIKEKEVEKIKSQYYEYPFTKYLPLRKPDFTKLKANEVELIEDVLKKLSDYNAKQIRDYSHNDVPWLIAEDQGVIEYESVFYRAAPYSIREYHEDISRA